MANTRRFKMFTRLPPPITTGAPEVAPIAKTASWNELLLAKFPSFDPAWPDEVKTKWFASFNELMQQGQKENKS
jgi:hypothetical protein